jgi:hypothetical protein
MMKDTILHNGVEVKILQRELAFATYSASKTNGIDDMLIAKEHLFLETGEVIPNLSYYKNHKRTFWVTKEDKRNHQYKKEFEVFENLDAYTCTERELPYTLFNALNGYYPRGLPNVNDLYKSPYVYGTNPTLPSLLKRKYRKKWPKANSPFTLAAMDYEWDVVNGNGEILAGAVSFKHNLHIAVTAEFLGKQRVNAEETINKLLYKYLKEHMTNRKITPIISVVNSSAEIIINLFRSVHEWKPDILGFWNISGDIDKILESLKKYNIDPADVFSDPSVPKEYRLFKWKKDNQRRKKSNGDEVSVNFHDLWHKLTCTASFYCVCLKALFKRVRAADKNRNRYDLDTILHEILNLAKLKFKGLADNLTRVDWHKKMQTEHKLEYMVYLAFDCISLELLDEKTNDAALSFNTLSTNSDFVNFPSNPSKLSENIHYGLLDKNKGALCAVGGSMRCDIDRFVPGLKNWIIALPPELEYNMGRRIVNDYPTLRTNIILNAADIDVEGAYPTNGIILNISVATRVFEVCGCPTLSENERRAIGINLSNLRGNALSIAKKTHGYPELDSLLNDFIKSKEKENYKIAA